MSLCSGRVLAQTTHHPPSRPLCQTHLSITPTTSNNKEKENSVAGAAVGVGSSNHSPFSTHTHRTSRIFHPPSLAVRRHFYARRMQQATRTTSRLPVCGWVAVGGWAIQSWPAFHGLRNKHSTYFPMSGELFFSSSFYFLRFAFALLNFFRRFLGYIFTSFLHFHCHIHSHSHILIHLLLYFARMTLQAPKESPGDAIVLRPWSFV